MDTENRHRCSTCRQLLTCTNCFDDFVDHNFCQRSYNQNKMELLMKFQEDYSLLMIRNASLLTQGFANSNNSGILYQKGLELSMEYQQSYSFLMKETISLLKPRYVTRNDTSLLHQYENDGHSTSDIYDGNGSDPNSIRAYNNPTMTEVGPQEHSDVEDVSDCNTETKTSPSEFKIYYPPDIVKTKEEYWSEEKSHGRSGESVNVNKEPSDANSDVSPVASISDEDQDFEEDLENYDDLRTMSDGGQCADVKEEESESDADVRLMRPQCKQTDGNMIPVCPDDFSLPRGIQRQSSQEPNSSPLYGIEDGHTSNSLASRKNDRSLYAEADIRYPPDHELENTLLSCSSTQSSGNLNVNLTSDKHVGDAEDENKRKRVAKKDPRDLISVSKFVEHDESSKKELSGIIEMRLTEDEPVIYPETRNPIKGVPIPDELVIKSAESEESSLTDASHADTCFPNKDQEKTGTTPKKPVNQNGGLKSVQVVEVEEFDEPSDAASEIEEMPKACQLHVELCAPQNDDPSSDEENFAFDPGLGIIDP